MAATTTSSGVISNRHFGSFLGSGIPPFFSLDYSPWGNIVHNKLHVTSRYYSSMPRYSYSSAAHLVCSTNKSSANQRTSFLGETEKPLSNTLQFRRYRCFLSFNSFNNSWGQQTNLDKHGLPNGRGQQSEYRKGTWTRASYPNDIKGPNFDPLSASEASNEIAIVGESTQVSSSPWWQLPKRWVIVLLCFTAFLLCNMDRVNMSIAILPMAAEFNWNPATVGLIQSSFFWGYLLTQIIGGIWADKIGGKRVLGFGVVWWSLATVLTPIAARLGLPFLLMMRAFMGIGEGVAMPAMNNILSKWIPVNERSRSLALVYSGMYLGSKFGWPSVFYTFGSLGSIWFVLWLKKSKQLLLTYAYSTPIEDPDLSAEEMKLIMGGSVSKEPVKEIPWKLILSKGPVWALIVSHFCHNWGTFILLTWMPTYYNQVLKFNLAESGLFCVLPWLTMAVFANIGGWIADTLVSRGVSITNVRKIMQSIGFLGPAFFLSQLSKVRTPAMAVLCMACSQGADAFSQSGLYSNHQDIGPRYSGVLLGLSNTAGVLAGVFGTAATGYILQKGSWDDVFKVAVVLYLVGTLVWNLFATGEKILD
ncbi:hypothetical protein MKW92_009942 [Papaver armeniacum]|nr:hypothetical protein MKW92_009942 [Papaver armeniacum]